MCGWMKPQSNTFDISYVHNSEAIARTSTERVNKKNKKKNKYANDFFKHGIFYGLIL